MRIAASILAADFSCLGAQMILAEGAGVDSFHLDVMDGHFVPNISFGALVIKSVRSHTRLPFDVHLMIEEPLPYLGDFIDAGADSITVHIESKGNIKETLIAIKNAGKRAGIAVKPGTDIMVVESLLGHVDQVLIMTVEPGFGGQKFMKNMLDKVTCARQLCKKNGHSVLLQVDGGINFDTVHQAACAGVDICVAGTSVFRENDMKSAVERLKTTADCK